MNTARPIVAGGTGATTAAAARSNLGAQPTTRAIDSTGSSDAYALATPETLASLTDGDLVYFVANHTNTGAATLNVDTLGAKNIQKVVSGTPTALAAGDLTAGGHYSATYDSSVGSGTWIVHNPDSFGSSGTGIANVVEDTTPQLGGDLDVNGNGIAFTGATVTDVTGADTLIVSGTAGTPGNLVQWNADGDAVDASIATSAVATLTGLQTLTNKTLTTPTLTLANAAGAAPTTDGEIKFDRTGENLEVGDGTGTKIFSHDAGAATLTNKTLTGVVVTDEIAHDGDTNNKWALGTDTQDFQTGGSSRLDISDSGVRLGGANARVTTILDEDAMGSDSATALATQQSIKAYVDASATSVTPETASSLASGTTDDFTGIASGASRITIMLDEVSTSGADEFLIQLGDSGGIEATGYSGGVRDSGGQDYFSSGFQVTRSHSASLDYSGVITLVRVASSAWVMSGTTSPAATNEPVFFAGRKNTSGTLTQIRLTTTGGTDTFDGGQWSIIVE